MQSRIIPVVSYCWLLMSLNTTLPAAIAQVYYVGDQSTLKDNNGTASYHDPLNWLNYRSPGGVVPGTTPVQYDDADGPGIPGNGKAVFDPATDHRPGNVGGTPPDPSTYGRPNYIYFGDFLDRRTFGQDDPVPGGVARPNSVEVTSGTYTFDLGSNNFGKAGGLSVTESIVVGSGAGANTSLTIRNGAVTQDLAQNWAGLTVGNGDASNGLIVVDGTEAKLEIARDVWLGSNGGTGRIDVINGGQLMGRSIGTGLYNGPTGRVPTSFLNVHGAGSFVRGFSGISNGDLVVSAGGKVVSLLPDGSKNRGWLGPGDGNDGGARITGNGSSWTEISVLTVGGVYHTNTNGNGRLAIANGGYVESEGLVIGNRSLSSGEVEVTGHNSQLMVTNYAYLGDDGHGSVLISGGGNLTTNGGASIGNQSNGVGTVTVTGSASRWVSGGQVRVGASGDGDLTVKSGAVVQSGSLSVGYAAGSEGAVEVTGAQSSLTTNNGYLGDDGQGSVLIAQSGVMTTTSGAYVGHRENGVGSVTVTGSGSRWISNGQVNVGNYGDGQVVVQNGAVVQSGSLSVGYAAGSEGTVEVTGAQSSLTTNNNAFVGDNGHGSVLISNGGKLTTNGNGASIGNQSTGVGSVTVAGSQSGWVSGGQVRVGTWGDGHLTVESGAAVQFSTMAVGSLASSEGTVEVTGAQSGLTTNSAFVGDNGNGSVLISNGGKMTTNSAAFIGNQLNGVGSVTVTGSGSRWETGVSVVVGYAGDGQLTVKNAAVAQNAAMLVGFTGDGAVSIESGAKLDAGANFVLGNSTGSQGTVDVTGSQSSLTTTTGTIGGSVSIVGGKIRTDGGGDGTLNIRNGGQATSTQVAVGFNGTGKANVTGSGSRWDVTEGLGVGYFQSGTLSISQGGVVDAAYAGVAGTIGSSGQISVTGSGSTLRIATNAPGSIGPVGSLQLGGSLGVTNALGPVPDGIGGTASLVVSNSGRVTVPSVLSLWGGAAVDVTNGGLVQIGNTTSTQSGSLQIGAGGTLQGSGVVRGNVFSHSGVIRPEFASGVLSIEGNLTHNGQLQLDLGPNGFDQVHVDGKVTLGGVLQLHQAANFQPTIDDEFRVLDAAAVTGRFSQLANYKIGDQLQIAPFIDTTGVTLRVVLSGDATLDHLVDGADYTVWADNYLSTNAKYIQADFNNDGLVDGADYTVWADHYLASADGRRIAASGISSLSQYEAQIATVPEPSSLALAVASLIGGVFLTGRYRAES